MNDQSICDMEAWLMASQGFGAPVLCSDRTSSSTYVGSLQEITA